jgi:hypothetical protein
MDFFRVACNGGSDEPLNIHLKRITDSAYTRKTLGANDIDGEFIAPVIQESHDSDCRREIMRHLRECLSESSGKRWQKIYGGMALTEKLMQHGSHDLAIEVAQGHHFDLVQKVSFLEHFDAAARGCTDRRAQNVVRAKASELLAVLIPLLRRAADEELPQDAGLQGKDLNIKDTASICSKDTKTTGSTKATGSNAAPSERSSPPESPGEPASPSKRPPAIDASFADFNDWLESGGYSSASPRDSTDGDSDWEPIGQLPVRGRRSVGRSSLGSNSDAEDTADQFFTPMPAPAAPSKPKHKQSL